MNWKVYSQEKPNKDGDYLCYIHRKGIKIRQFFMSEHDNNPRFLINGYEDLNVTHWLPLPQSPYYIAPAKDTPCVGGWL